MSRSVLLVDPLYHPKGGGAAVTFWALQALVSEYEVTVLAWRDIDVEEGNRLFGTSIDRGAFDVRAPGAPLRWLGETIHRVDPSPWSVQRWAFLMRYARSLAPDYDVVFSTNGEVSFGVPVIQYVHYPYLGEAVGRRAIRTGSGRHRPWRVISGLDFDDVTANRTLVNSDWTGRVFESLYDTPSHTLYPPVPGAFTRLPWEARENGFVCVGRLNRDKRLDLVIDTIAAARERHPDLQLRLIGSPMPEEPGGPEYLRHLRSRAAEHADWLHLEEGVSRSRLLDLLSRSRYGIHAKEDEHFGIAVAEMVKAGCVTFTHRSGGQVEIVRDERLLFSDEEDALDKVKAVVGDPERQAILRSGLEARAEEFSTERFVRELLEHTEAFLSR